MKEPNRRWHGIVALALAAATLPAQRPAPLAEGAPGTWTADEAMVFHVMAELAAASAKDHALPAPLQRPGGVGLRIGPAYTAAVHPFAGDRFADPGLPAKDQGYVLYAWPREGAGRTFCFASTGTLLVAELGANAAAPQADAATGAGSRGGPADLLTSPGKGRNGALWTTAAMVPTKRLRVQLRDEDGKPVANGRVALLPGTWVVRDRTIYLPFGHQGLREVDAALPAGMWTLDGEGAGEVRGVAARGLIVCAAGDDGRTVALSDQLVRVEAQGLVLTLPRALKQQAQRNANESAAVATLRNLASAQAQCQACSVIDANRNGAGEYGFFAELAGAQAVRTDEAGGTGTQKIVPPVLSKAFANVKASQVVRSGYVFQIWLPDSDADAVAEADIGGGGGRNIDAAKAEVMWCAYAWPVEAGSSGQQVFFVNQDGDVLMSHNPLGAYSGAGKAPLPTAAFDRQGNGKLDSKIAANAKGHDGQHWLVVQ